MDIFSLHVNMVFLSFLESHYHWKKRLISAYDLEAIKAVDWSIHVTHKDEAFREYENGFGAALYHTGMKMKIEYAS